jgi:transposase-like protein
LSFRDVQKLMLERGVDVSYETIRAWCDRFGQQYATSYGVVVRGRATNGTSMTGTVNLSQPDWPM